MDAPVTIQVSQADVAATERMFSRMQLHLGKTADEALVWTVWYVAKAFGASTRKSARRRRVMKTNLGTDGIARMAGLGKGMRVTQAVGWWSRYVETYRGGELVNRFIARDQDAEPFQKIRNSGLAKKSWLWMVPAVKRGGDTSRQADVIRHNNGPDRGVTLHDKLPYASQALNDNVGSAIARAERAFNHYMYRNAMKKLGLTV